MFTQPAQVGLRHFLLPAGLAGGGALLVGGLLFGLLVLRGSTPGIDSMVPSSTDAYATAYVDPSLGQKVNLLRVVHTFPDLRKAQDLNNQVDRALDESFTQLGISFSRDVRPWLGGRVSLLVQISQTPNFAFLVQSNNDQKAKAALIRLRSGSDGRNRTWQDHTYDGITLSVGTAIAGTSASSQQKVEVYSYLDHVVVLSNSEAVVHDVIDTAQGKKPTLFTTQDYQSTVKILPTDRLLLLYVNGHALVAAARKDVGAASLSGLTVPAQTWKELDAFTGIGFTLSAQPNGLTGDVEVRLNPAKMDAATKAAFSSTSAHHNPVLSWVPARAFGLLALTSIKEPLQSALNQSSTLGPDVSPLLNGVGLPSVVNHLTGDAGLELDGGVGAYPEGAILIGTDDPGSMTLLFSQVADLAQLGQASSSNAPTVTAKKQIYHGVDITSFDLSQLGTYGLAPAYAVTGGMGILASSAQEIKQLIGAHTTGATIETTASFKASSTASYSNPQALLYLDVTQAASAIERSVPVDQSLSAAAAAKLTPVRALMMTSYSGSDQAGERVFVLIQ